MGARDLLQHLAGAGLSITADGGQLVIRPASRLTGDMRTALRAAKPELLALLQAEQDRTNVRRALLLRWGWPAIEAEGLADRLARRDRENEGGGADDRVSCTECTHYRPGRCRNHQRAGLSSPELGRDLASLLQRCPGKGA